MLDRVGNQRGCIVCGRPFGDPAFVYDEGEPAYWSDRGLICSIACGQVHERQRREAGEPMTEPADNPLASPR